MINLLKFSTFLYSLDKNVDAIDNKHTGTFNNIVFYKNDREDIAILQPVEQKKNPIIGMFAISRIGDSKVKLSTRKAIPPFCIAVSREMAIIYR